MFHAGHVKQMSDDNSPANHLNIQSQMMNAFFIIVSSGANWNTTRAHSLYWT
jgi:hypothetical protein